jgi:predicted Zn-dependent peptidase
MLFLSLLVAAPALPQSGFRLPPAKKMRLANGLTVILMEQHEVPIVSLKALVRAGGVMDPAGREGLAAVTAELLRRGTARRTADQIAAEIDFVGGELEFDADYDYASAEAEFLKKDLTLGLDLLADTLQNPSFLPAEIEKLLKQRVDTIRQHKDQAQAAIERYYAAYLYGAHPYARPVSGDERTLAAIRREDVRKFYQDNYGPATTTLVIVGDFTSGEMERAIGEKFGSWKGGATRPSIPLPAPAPVKGRRLLLVDKPDSTQTFFLIGNTGIARTNPDRPAIDLVNTIFGGRFTSMLNDALRVNSGLTYGARSEFDRHRVAGPFAISTFTQNATTVKAIDLALEILRKLHAEGLSEEQLRSAQAYLKGQYPTRLETSDQLAAYLAEQDFYGLDLDEVNGYFARLDAVTTADARRIIRQYFPQDDLAFVLIGKAGEIREAVRKYAPQVDLRKIDQPGFK